MTMGLTREELKRRKEVREAEEKRLREEAERKFRQGIPVRLLKVLAILQFLKDEGKLDFVVLDIGDDEFVVRFRGNRGGLIRDEMYEIRSDQEKWEFENIEQMVSQVWKTIKEKKDEAARVAVIRRDALAKLTVQEKEALGLEKTHE